MLNRVIIMGRITQDLEVRQTPTGASVLRFNVAVDRPPAKQGGEKLTDFITCVAWNQRAEFINRYFGKGRMIAIEGSIRTGSYTDKNGVKRYTTEVWVDNTSFTGEPKAQGNSNYSNNYSGYSQQGGYPQNDYQGGGYQNNNYQQAAPAQNNQAPSNDALSIGDLGDFEEVISDDGVPF